MTRTLSLMIAAFFATLALLSAASISQAGYDGDYSGIDNGLYADGYAIKHAGYGGYGYGQHYRKRHYDGYCGGPIREKRVCDYDPGHCWKERECYYIRGHKYCRYYNKCSHGYKRCHWVRRHGYGCSY